MSEPAGVDSGVLPPWCRQRPWRLVVIDVLAAMVIALLTVSATFRTALGLSSGTAVVVWLVALAVSVALVVRRRWPIPVLGVVVASAIVAVLLGMSLRATALGVAVTIGAGWTLGHSVRARRERAALHHGTLIAGWQPHGGFAVHAHLPYQTPEPA